MEKLVFKNKIPKKLPIPNLVENQKKSFYLFKDKYIREVLEEIFPIRDENGVFELSLLDVKLEEPAITREVAKKLGESYNGSLKTILRLINKDTGEISETEVYLGEIPFMTDGGTFIFNGVERVIVNQMVRSPGVSFSKSITDRGQTLIECRVIPYDGTWLRITNDTNNRMWVNINQVKKRIPLTVFLKTVTGMSNEDIINIFGENELIMNSLKMDPTETQEEAIYEFFKIMRPSEPKDLERLNRHLDNMFFNPRRYKLEKVGRYKINKKLNLRYRILGKRLAEAKLGYEENDIIDKEFVQHFDENELLIYNDYNKKIKVISNKNEHGEEETSEILTTNDYISIINYFLHLFDGIGEFDDIDHLGNRRVRLCGELLKDAFRIGMLRVERQTIEKMNVLRNQDEEVKRKTTPNHLINPRPLVGKMKEFLGSGQLSQFLEQVNPLAEISHKRRISALGPGGFQKDRAGIEVRDVHHSHYGRICPIETPEGQNVGLITNSSLYSRINEYGFIETPYFKVENGRITDEVIYLQADDEEEYYIAKRDSFHENGEAKEDYITVRYKEEYPTVYKNEVELCDVDTGQIAGLSVSAIPFVEHNDGARALMGANMQRQALPGLKPDNPIIGTGIEQKIALDTNSTVIAKDDGVVKDINKDYLVIKYKNNKIEKIPIKKFERTNDDTNFTYKLKVNKNDTISKGQILMDSNFSNEGELSIGQNVLVAFMPWKGYNFEDAIVISERLVKEDIYTTIVIKEYKIDIMDTNHGEELLISKRIPNASKHQMRHLDDEGIVKIGSKVVEGDILVGKITPKPKEDLTPEEKFLNSVFDDVARNFRNTSLRMPNGTRGTVIDIVRITKDDVDLPSGILERIKVYVAEKRKIKEGDKMAGRHGNKGVVSIVVPEEDMPYMEDGTPIDIILNPLGVPSRMNIGQLMETHLGMVGKMLNKKFRIPIFDGLSWEEIQRELKETGLPEDGKFTLYDGLTGEAYEEKVTVGVIYMLKLNHQIDDKMHARSIGPYSLITQQPTSGRSQHGGQRFGEMEVWALEAHGAANLLKEMLTTKSDDVMGRNELYESIVRGRNARRTSETESFKLLIKELNALGFDVKIKRGK